MNKKICPLKSIVMILAIKDKIFKDGNDLCLGEKCQWWWKCKEPEINFSQYLSDVFCNKCGKYYNPEEPHICFTPNTSGGSHENKPD